MSGLTQKPKFILLSSFLVTNGFFKIHYQFYGKAVTKTWACMLSARQPPWLSFSAVMARCSTAVILQQVALIPPALLRSSSF